MIRNRRSLQDQYCILRIRRRAFEAERDRAAESENNDRFSDMIRSIRRIDREIQDVLGALSASSYQQVHK
jgi:hypothetical protein